MRNVGRGNKDASSESYRGLKMDGEPCVWCGGVPRPWCKWQHAAQEARDMRGKQAVFAERPCTDHSPALCASYDFLANGQGLACSSMLRTFLTGRPMQSGFRPSRRGRHGTTQLCA